VADEGKRRDFQTKPDNRPVEEKLLAIIFSGESRGAAVRRVSYAGSDGEATAVCQMSEDAAYDTGD
jgi:hypothetical protein